MSSPFFVKGRSSARWRDYRLGTEADETREPSPDHDSLSTSGVRRAFRLILRDDLACGSAPPLAGRARHRRLRRRAPPGMAARERVPPPHGPSLAAGVGLLVSGLAIAAVGSRRRRSSPARCPPKTRLRRHRRVRGPVPRSCPVPLFRFETEAARAAAWIVSFLLFRLFDIWKLARSTGCRSCRTVWNRDRRRAGGIARGRRTVVASTLIAERHGVSAPRAGRILLADEPLASHTTWRIGERPDGSAA